MSAPQLRAARDHTRSHVSGSSGRCMGRKQAAPRGCGLAGAPVAIFTLCTFSIQTAVDVR